MFFFQTYEHMGKPKNQLAGQTFGHLTASHSIGSDRHGNSIWICKCVCGNVHAVTGTLLKRGHSKSCGCSKSSMLAQAKTKHGMCGTKEYHIWAGIKSRCTNPNVEEWPRYGGRGIQLCDEWMDSFESFYNHVGPIPDPGHMIDRINNNGHYEPGNVRWTTRDIQNNNTRANRVLTCSGKTQNLGQWAKELGIHQITLGRRIDRQGWSVEKALTTPKLKSQHEPHSRI